MITSNISILVPAIWSPAGITFALPHPPPLCSFFVCAIPTQARHFIDTIGSMFRNIFQQEDFCSLLNRQKLNPQATSVRLGPEERQAVLGWVDWTVDYCRFFASSLLTLAQQRRQQAGGAGAEAANMVLPCIRLVLDQAFLKNLTGAVIFCLFSVPVCCCAVAFILGEKGGGIFDAVWDACMRLFSCGLFVKEGGTGVTNVCIS
jgi:hypothetical protein